MYYIEISGTPICATVSASDAVNLATVHARRAGVPVVISEALEISLASDSDFRRVRVVVTPSGDVDIIRPSEVNREWYSVFWNDYTESEALKRFLKFHGIRFESSGIGSGCLVSMYLSNAESAMVSRVFQMEV